MEQYAKYLRKSRFDRDYAEMSVEETLKRHEAILDRLAGERGYRVTKTYYEVVSGESIAARPEIQKLLEEVNAGLYAGVLVVDLERLARGNSADQAYISQVFQFSGTKIITPAKVYDPSDEFDEEYFEFGLFMSRREYKTITRRLIRGRDSSASEGKYISSIAPYGYRRVKLPSEKGYTLEPHPQEAEAVKKMFELFLHGTGTKQIANALNDLCVPTRHGGPWSYSTVGQILANPVYMGKIRRGWSRQVKSVEDGVVKKRVKRCQNMEEYQLYDGLHPPLVSEADFMRTQDIRRERKPAARVKKAFDLQNAFAGLIFCARCGRRVGRTTLSAVQHSRARLRCVNARSCRNASADYQAVEREIVAALGEWLSGYRVRINATGYEDELAACQTRLNRLMREEEKLKTQLDNAHDLVEQGVYTPAVFRERSEKLVSALEELGRKRAELETVQERLSAAKDSGESLIPKTEALLESYERMTNRERNMLLKAVLRRIEYEKGADGKIVIDLYPRLPKM